MPFGSRPNAVSETTRRAVACPAAKASKTAALFAAARMGAQLGPGTAMAPSAGAMSMAAGRTERQTLPEPPAKSDARLADTGARGAAGGERACSSIRREDMTMRLGRDVGEVIRPGRDRDIRRPRRRADAIGTVAATSMTREEFIFGNAESG